MTLQANTASAEINCRQCQTDIPLDAALTPAGAEYVQHYCGSDCLQGFLSRAKVAAAGDAMVSAPQLV